jgi:hypothetical protein
VRIWRVVRVPWGPARRFPFAARDWPAKRAHYPRIGPARQLAGSAFAQGALKLTEIVTDGARGAARSANLLLNNYLNNRRFQWQLPCLA